MRFLGRNRVVPSWNSRSKTGSVEIESLNSIDVMLRVQSGLPLYSGNSGADSLPALAYSNSSFPAADVFCCLWR